MIAMSMLSMTPASSNWSSRAPLRARRRAAPSIDASEGA
jgi:hypothetical protein